MDREIFVLGSTEEGAIVFQSSLEFSLGSHLLPYAPARVRYSLSACSRMSWFVRRWVARSGTQTEVQAAVNFEG